MAQSGDEPDGRRDTLEILNDRFERIGAWSFDHRTTVLAVCLALLVGCAVLADRARFDNSFESYFDTGDEVYRAYTRYREDFGSDEIAYLVYEAPDRVYGPFDLEVMRKIADLTRELESVPFVREVTSLTNVEHLKGVPDGIEIYDLMEDFPQTQEELLRIRDVALAESTYLDNIVSRDGRYAAIVLEMDRGTVDPVEQLRFDPDGGDGLENLYPQVSYAAIEKILAKPEYAGIRFHHVGDVALNSIYNRVVSSESERLGLATFVVIGLMLMLFFGSVTGVLAPMVVVALSVVVAIAFVAAMGWTLDMMFIMMPVLLIAVGVADAVHILAEFRAMHAELGDRREAARRTLHLVGTPCLLTSLTTAAGFASMSLSPIKSISHFAIYAAVGVVAAFLLSVTLLMALLSYGPRHVASTERAIVRAKGGRTVQRALGGVADFVVRRRRGILAVFGVLFALSAAGMAQLRVDSNFMSEFSEEEPIRVETELVDRTMGGTLSFVYLFDSGESEGIKEPAALRDIERVADAADDQGGIVKKHFSINDVLKDLNKAFHAEDESFDVLPETRDLVAQYLLLYEMSGGEEAQDYVSTDYARASLELRCRSVETSALSGMSRELDRYLKANPLEATRVSVTGMGALYLKLQEYITRSQIIGFLIAFVVIALLLMFIFQSVRTGLIAMVPNLSPVVLTLGLMGWFDVPLDYVRLMLATVAIGISVDDTIHHTTRYRMEFQRTGCYATALRSSVLDVGRALVITSVVLVVGFMVFCFSTLDTLVIFGTVLASTISIALAADFLLMPALVLTFRPFGPERAGAAVAAPQPAIERATSPSGPQETRTQSPT